MRREDSFDGARIELVLDFKYAENDAKYVGINENPARECQWEFVRDAAGRIVYELAYNKNEKLVWGFAYLP